MADRIRYTQVILTQSQWSAIARIARREGTTVARFIRELVLAAVEREQTRRRSED
jgi:predicted DNA-binding ribbon-helix-helix protein